MNAKTTIVLVMLVAAGCVLIVGQDLGWFRGVGGSAESPTMPSYAAPTGGAESRDVFEDHPTDVTRLEITSDGHTVAFAKGSGVQWEIVEPIRAAAIPWSVDSLARLVAGMKYQQTFEPNQPGSPTLAQMGLDDPVATVGFEYEGGRVSLAVGRRDPLSGDTYVQVDSRPTVYLVKGDLGESFNKDLSEFRSKDLMSVAFGDVRAVAVQTREPVKIGRASCRERV